MSKAASLRNSWSSSPDLDGAPIVGAGERGAWVRVPNTRPPRAIGGFVAWLLGWHPAPVTLPVALTHLVFNRFRWVFAGGDGRDAECERSLKPWRCAIRWLCCSVGSTRARFTDTDRPRAPALSRARRLRKPDLGLPARARRALPPRTQHRRVHPVEGAPDGRDQTDPRSHPAELVGDHPLPGESEPPRVMRRASKQPSANQTLRDTSLPIWRSGEEACVIR